MHGAARSGRGGEALAWALAGAWAASIFAAIPLARSIEHAVRDALGQRAFGWLAIGAVLAATAAALTVIGRSRGATASPRDAHSPRAAVRAAWLFAVAAAFAFATASLWSNPEEAMHFVQYGVLSLLLQRAVAFRLPDASSYFVAALAGALVGCADEAVQWVVPGRYFGLRDIAINAFAASLVQVGLAMGIRPAGVARTTSRAGRRVALRIALALWAALLAFALNTPARVAVWAPRLPGLAFLATNESTMMEYGHRYDAPDIGVFRSRLAPEELAREDATRAAAGAALLDAYRDAYGDFLVDVPPQRDPFVHELRVHLFRRDRYLEFWRAQTGGSPEQVEERRKLATVAAREDRLVRRFFARTFAASGYALPPDVAARVARDELPGLDYESTVSRDLVTSVGEGELLAVFALALVALLTALLSQRESG
ncbi:MAG: VanZ family protein [Myxococcales bacterium]|nr:VanZ family protein [Myxococcales bacterium]